MNALMCSVCVETVFESAVGFLESAFGAVILLYCVIQKSVSIILSTPLSLSHTISL